VKLAVVVVPHRRQPNCQIPLRGLAFFIYFPDIKMSTIDEFKHHILVQKEQHATHLEVILWLRNHGVNVSERTLARRLKDWGFQQNFTSSASSELISCIDYFFYQTL
jgi:hypothetical protein